MFMTFTCLRSAREHPPASAYGNNVQSTPRLTSATNLSGAAVARNEEMGQWLWRLSL